MYVVHRYLGATYVKWATHVGGTQCTRVLYEYMYVATRHFT